MAIRILQVVSSSMKRAGKETFLMNLYRSIDREKIQFDFLVNTDKKGDYDEEIIEMGGKIQKVIVNQSDNQLKRIVKRFSETYKLLKYNEYDVIHIHSSRATVFIELVAAKLAGVKMRILHSHNSNADRKAGHVVMKPFASFLSTDYFACSTDAGKWMFTSNLVKKGKVKFIRNAIDSKRFDYDELIRENKRKEIGVESNFVIGHIGRFSTQKNHIFLIDIFYELNKKCSEAVLLLIGSGPLEESIRAKVKEMNLESSVRFLGVRGDIEELLQAFDCFLLPSLFEGLPVVLVEAQAAGLGIITSDVVTREVDITGNIKYLSLEDSSSLWSDSILKQRKSFNRVSKRSDVISAGFDMDENSNYFEQLYMNK